MADIERAGPYCMMAEALAMANGDPTMLGYLLGGNFGRGFPQYVREFNANFLALPALPSERLVGGLRGRGSRRPRHSHAGTRHLPRRGQHRLCHQAQRASSAARRWSSERCCFR